MLTHTTTYAQRSVEKNVLKYKTECLCFNLVKLLLFCPFSKPPPQGSIFYGRFCNE